MTQVVVGGANGLIDRLIGLVGWRATSTTTDQERVDALNALNYCDQLIAQSEALMYLTTETSIALPNNQDYVALPANPVIDFGKDIVLEQPGGEGIIEYRPPDKFAALRTSVGAYVIGADPAYYTIVRDHATGERRFKFKPKNSSGGPLTIPLVAQVVPPAMTDDGASKSMLPDGYELTLLLPAAQEYIQANRHEFGIENLSAAVGATLQELYGKQRANKEKPLTDRGRERRKVDTTTVEEGF